MPYNPYPYNVYPATSYASYTPQPVQYTQQTGNSYTAPQQSQSGIIWVDGEVGAKAYQLPNGWPANTPMPLWDTNDTIIYLKSTNPMGMPNPLQKIHYRMEEQAGPTGTAPYHQTGPALLSSGDTGHTEQYVTREDLDRMKEELRESIAEAMNSSQPQTSPVKKGGKAE